MKFEYDAVLKNFQRMGKQYLGDIYEDKKGRWADGTPIITSKIVSVDGDILQTRNTKYKLVEKD